MNETYVECLVKRKTPTYMVLLKVVTGMLAAGFVLLGMMNFLALIIGVGLGVLTYFIHLNSDLEYEYLYVDKELTVDKVLAKSRRKRVASFDLERMEMFAPIKSYHLDSFKNRTCKDEDYSSREEKQPDVRYALYYNGEKRLILEPSQEMVRAMKMAAPRKVFTD